MYPSYSEVVSVVFRQVMGNFAFEQCDTVNKLKIHATVTNVLNSLIPNLEHVEVYHDSFVSGVKAKIMVEGGDFLTVWAEIDWSSQTSIKGFA